VRGMYQPLLFDASPVALLQPSRRARSRRASFSAQTSRRTHGTTHLQLAFPISPSVMVKEFHAAVGGVTNHSPTVDVPPQLRELRLRLIEEEAQELADAFLALNLVTIADALGDLVYVTFGAALTFGIDLDAVLAEIHRSNMTKLGRDGRPVIRSDGKILKGPDYSPPRLEPIIGIQHKLLGSALKSAQVAPMSQVSVIT
jgi:predicted HAD superfamily Cof-like phosphohydrolase